MNKLKIYICTDCHHVGECKKILRGTKKTEIFWWLIISFVAIFYSLYRRLGSKKVCQDCGSEKIILTKSKYVADLMINQQKL
jgi:hypothetical protein